MKTLFKKYRSYQIAKYIKHRDHYIKMHNTHGDEYRRTFGFMCDEIVLHSRMTWVLLLGYTGEESEAKLQDIEEK